MLIRDPTKAKDASKELKVKIPVQQHLRLHAHRVMTGEQISSVVTRALDDYFREHA